MNEQKAWYPVARIEDLLPRHVFHSQLHGFELALWRSDAGEVNAWENRCPHRSVRLTLGVNTGERLRCQYHGWQYRSGDGQCANIPASSQTTPPASLCAQTFAVQVCDGLVWSRLDQPQDGSVPASSVAPWPVSLRSRTIHAGLDAVSAGLARYAALDPHCQSDSVSVSVRESGAQLELSWRGEQGLNQVSFWLQPASDEKTVLHASCAEDGRSVAQLRRWHERLLTRLTRRVENTDSTPAVPVRMPELRVSTAAPTLAPRSDLIEVQVRSSWAAAEEILAFELVTTQGEVLDFQAGAHIDVHTPAGLVRQYSLVNAPDERGHLLIGVKREPESRGGSRSMHDGLAVGDRLRVSRPKNHFPLRPDKQALLIAGGIGITPILAMGSQLQRSGQPYALHYFARSPAHVAFAERLDALSGVNLHTAFDPQQTRAAIDTALRGASAETHLYVCGPRPLIDLVQELAGACGHPPGQVHFELFANEVSHADDQPFRVRLARSGGEFEVPAGVTLAQALERHGAAVETSCEQGVCGTCRIRVIDGEPEHRDVYLTEAEKLSGSCLMPCVSRGRSELLVLDL